LPEKAVLGKNSSPEKSLQKNQSIFCLKNPSCYRRKVCHVRVTVDLPTVCVVTIFSVECKDLELELEQPKKKIAMPTKFIKELGKYIQEKFDKYVNIES